MKLVFIALVCFSLSPGVKADDPCPFKDDWSFKVDGKNGKGCGWVGNYPNERCLTSTGAKEACVKTCCGINETTQPPEAPEPCPSTDDWTFKVDDKPGRGCAWVRKYPEERCLVSTGAKEACGKSCCEVTTTCYKSGWQTINAITLVTRGGMTSSVEFYQKLGLKVSYGGPDSEFTTMDDGPDGDGENRFHVNLVVPSESEEEKAIDAYPDNIEEYTWNRWGRYIVYVDDVDRIYDKAVGNGLKPEFAPTIADWGERYFQILDPSGNEIAFAKPLEATV